MRKRKEEKSKPAVRNYTKLDVELVDRLCNLIAKGVPPQTARDYLCISDTAFYTWHRRGETYLNSGMTPEEDEICGYFVQQLRQALATYEIILLQKIHGNAKNAGMCLTLLSLRDRGTFGRNTLDGDSDDTFDADETFV